MMDKISRPYLIIPRLVEQPTWGGSYIAAYKNLKDQELRAKKIGQSYELFGGSLLSLYSDTSDRQFLEDVVWYNKKGTPAPGSEFVGLDELLKENHRKVLGPAVKSPSMPLLLKFTQALGNSFQLHVKKPAAGWKPKPESWFYLEDGVLTFGIKQHCDLAQYKAVCFEVEDFMKNLSGQVKSRTISYEEAARQAAEFIKKANPWQFVNVHRVKKHTTIDLSPGGLHHSWEEDAQHCPLGNVVFEIQQDVSDDDSTIRSFDKGKIKKNGEIRPIQVEDYFANLDTDPGHNDLSLATRKRSGTNLLTTPYYSLDLVPVNKEIEQETLSSFIHLFVVEGGLEVESASHTVSVDRGYSCLVPHTTGIFSLIPTKPNTVVLKSYIA